MENKKNNAIFFCLKREKAFKPKMSITERFSMDLDVGHLGKVRQYKNNKMPMTPEVMNCISETSNPIMSNKPRQTDHKKNCRFRDRFFSIHFISTMVCFMMVKRMTYTSHPRKAAKQPLRKVVASVVVNAYTQ